MKSLFVEIQYCLLKKYNKEFREFEKDLLTLDADRFYQDGERIFTKKESKFMNIICRKRNFLQIEELKIKK